MDFEHKQALHSDAHAKANAESAVQQVLSGLCMLYTTYSSKERIKIKILIWKVKVFFCERKKGRQKKKEFCKKKKRNLCKIKKRKKN